MMDWKRLHHLYLGVIGAFACLSWTAVNLGTHRLDRISWSLVGAIVFLAWALDDAVYHHRGKRTPCWWIEQGLRRIRLYQKFSDWLNKLFQGGKGV